MAGTRKFNESEVLDIAIDVFSCKGFNSTTMLDLAKETGVQRGSLYNAYQNKNILFLKAFSHYTEKFLLLMENELRDSDVRAALTQFLETMIERLSGDKQMKGCFSTRTIMEAAQKCPDIHACLIHFLDGVEAIIAKRLTQAVNDQQFTGDPQSTARYLVALTRGMAVVERVYNDKARMTEIYQTALEYLPFNNTPNKPA